MEKRGSRGLLVVVEGVDGAGKSSVLRHLADCCKGLRDGLVLSREPTDGPHGRRLRESAVTGRLALETELELFLNDRRQHVEGLIEPALERGALVLLDRYYFSTAAYQGARGADPDAVLLANEAFAPEPDLVLLLDCAPVVTLERIRLRGGGADAFERIESLEAVRRIFLGIQRPFIRVVDAAREPGEVARECVELLEELLVAKGGFSLKSDR